MIFKVRTGSMKESGWALFDNVMELDYRHAAAQYVAPDKKKLRCFEITEKGLIGEECEEPITRFFADFDPDSTSQGFLVNFVRRGRGGQTLYFDTIGFILNDHGDTIETLRI